VGQHARLEVDAFKDRKFNGVVTDIANSAKNNDTSTTAASSSTGTQDATKFQVKIRIKEKEVFLPGMSVTAEIETRSRTNVLTVPIQSVTQRVPKEPDSKSGSTNAARAHIKDAGMLAGTNELKTGKRANEASKPVDVVFVADGDHVRMVPVKRGIADDDYWEIEEGLKEGEEVVSGGSKAINRELEDGKKIVIGTNRVDSATAKN
jgi:HlyD family secretion protein